jgi:hypothetical protein
MTAPTASGASANAQSSPSIPDIFAPTTTAEATRGLRPQRDGPGNNASPAVFSGNSAAIGTAVQFQHPQAKRKWSSESKGKILRTQNKLAFGLQVFERDPVSSTPASVNCRFCFRFGRSLSGKCEMQTTLLSPSKAGRGQISLSSATGIEVAWRPVGLRFPLLKQFCGGFSSVVLGTAKVESDFCVLKWEFDQNRSSLTEFSLEGIIQCKQFQMLSSGHHSSPSTTL